MNQVDLHPEELFDRARRGKASAIELERLQVHLENCPACRFEHALVVDCAEGAAIRAGDEAVVARIRGATLRAFERRGPSDSAPPLPSSLPVPISRAAPAMRAKRRGSTASCKSLFRGRPKSW